MVTFRAKIPYRNIVSELDFFKNQITNYPSLVSRTESSFEGLNFEGIIPCRSLEDRCRCDAVSIEVRTKEREKTADCTVLFHLPAI